MITPIQEWRQCLGEKPPDLEDHTMQVWMHEASVFIDVVRNARALFETPRLPRGGTGIMDRRRAEIHTSILTRCCLTTLQNHIPDVLGVVESSLMKWT